MQFHPLFTAGIQTTQSNTGVALVLVPDFDSLYRPGATHKYSIITTPQIRYERGQNARGMKSPARRNYEAFDLPFIDYVLKIHHGSLGGRSSFPLHIV